MPVWAWYSSHYRLDQKGTLLWIERRNRIWRGSAGNRPGAISQGAPGDFQVKGSGGKPVCHLGESVREEIHGCSVGCGLSRAGNSNGPNLVSAHDSDVSEEEVLRCGV